MKRCGRSKIGPQALVIVIARESESGGRGGSAGGVEIVLHVLAVLGDEVSGGLYVCIGLDDLLGVGEGDARVEKRGTRLETAVEFEYGFRAFVLPKRDGKADVAYGDESDSRRS